MFRWQGWWHLVLVGLALAIGCDKAPTPPPVTQPQPEEAELDVEPPAATRPTTQELLNGETRKVSLGPLPLAVQVPQSWEVRTVGQSQMPFLLGPAPGGQDLRISLQIGAPVTPERLDLMLEAMQKSATQPSTPGHRKVQVRAIDDMKIVEEREVSPSPVTPGEMRVVCRITVFVRRDLDYAAYVLDILGLDAQGLEQTEPLLRKVFDSIEYQPQRAAG